VQRMRCQPQRQMEQLPEGSVPTSMPAMPAMPSTTSQPMETVTSPEPEPQEALSTLPAAEPRPVVAPPPEAFENTASTGLPTLPGAPPTVQPNVQPVPSPPMPPMPNVSPGSTSPPTPAPVAVPMPNLPTAPVPSSASPPSIWPWPQAEPWDDRLLAGKVKNAMEAAKMNRKEEATQILDEIGPHLGDRTRLMLYIGALLKSLGRSDALSSMLEIARKDYMDDEHVIAALKQLS